MVCYFCDFTLGQTNKCVPFAYLFYCKWYNMTCFLSFWWLNYILTVYPRIVSWICRIGWWKFHIVPAITFLLCNEILNNFLTRLQKLFEGENLNQEQASGSYGMEYVYCIVFILFSVGVYLFIYFCPTVQCLLISELVAGKKNLIVERDLAEGVSIK